MQEMILHNPPGVPEQLFTGRGIIPFPGGELKGQRVVGEDLSADSNLREYLLR
jgi:hypothetical protein